MEFHLYEWISLPFPIPPCRVPGSPLPRLPLPALHVSLWPTMVPSLFCSLRGWARGGGGGGGYLGIFQRRGVIWGCPGQRKGESWVPGVTWEARGRPASRSARVKGGDGHACHKQLVTISSGSGESDAGENFTRLSAKTAWVYFCRVGETPSLLCIDTCLCYVVEIKSVIYL